MRCGGWRNLAFEEDRALAHQRLFLECEIFDEVGDPLLEGQHFLFDEVNVPSNWQVDAGGLHVVRQINSLRELEGS